MMMARWCKKICSQKEAKGTSRYIRGVQHFSIPPSRKCTASIAVNDGGGNLTVFIQPNYSDWAQESNFVCENTQVII